MADGIPTEAGYDAFQLPAMLIVVFFPRNIEVACSALPNAQSITAPLRWHSEYLTRLDKPSLARLQR